MFETTYDIDTLYQKVHKSGAFRRFSYLLQAAVAFPLILFIKVLPVDIASALGGKLAKIIGPKLKEHQVALMNLKLAFPTKTLAEREKIIIDEWENIGRTLGEFPHITNIKFISKRVKIEGQESFTKMKAMGQGGICLSIHMGNWELTSMIMCAMGLKANNVYRRPNNPYVEKIFRHRVNKHKASLIPKNEQSLFKMIRCIKNKETIGLLIDQKLNEGIEVNFFGKKAMTTPAPAILARRYGVPVLIGHVERIKGAHFRFVAEPLLFCPKTKNPEKDVIDFTQMLNDMVESWIRTNPSQWLWIHKRWNRDVFDNT